MCELQFKPVQTFTFIGLSRSPPHRDCRGIRKGLHVGFKLFFTTWNQTFEKKMYTSIANRSIGPVEKAICLDECEGEGHESADLTRQGEPFWGCWSWSDPDFLTPCGFRKRSAEFTDISSYSLSSYPAKQNHSEMTAAGFNGLKL